MSKFVCIVNSGQPDRTMIPTWSLPSAHLRYIQKNSTCILMRGKLHLQVQNCLGVAQNGTKYLTGEFRLSTVANWDARGQKAWLNASFRDSIVLLWNQNGFDRKSGRKRTFSKPSSVGEFALQSHTQKDFCGLMNDSFTKKETLAFEFFGAVWGTCADGRKQTERISI